MGEGVDRDDRGDGVRWALPHLHAIDAGDSGRLLVGLLARRAGVEGVRPRHGPDRRQLRAHVLERVRRRVVLLGLGVVEVGSNF